MATLHVTNGDAVVAELAAAAGVEPDGVLPWRDVLHDGPVPAGHGPDELAQVRAAHLASRGWTTAAKALREMRLRDLRLAEVAPDDEIVLWFEDDLYDALQLAQVGDRLAGRPGPVSFTLLPHPPRGDLRSVLRARQEIEPDGRPFAALRSPDPRAWLWVEAFARLIEELPDSRTGLSRLEREILEALDAGPLSPRGLFAAVAEREQPPWLGDLPLWSVADELAPLVERDGDRAYALTRDGRAVLAGEERRPRVDRWLGGVHLVPGEPGWAWDPVAEEIVEDRS